MMNESEKMTGMKERYLYSSFDTQEAFASWKRKEGVRSFFRALTVLILIAGIVAAAWLWYDNRTAEGNIPYIYAGIALGATLLLLIVNGIIRHAISNACRRAYDRFYQWGHRTRNISEHIKREKVDPMLENRIVISIWSYLTAPKLYVEDLEKRGIDIDDDEYQIEEEMVSKKKSHKEEPERFEGPVSSAIVYIDDVEVGAIDLNSDFSSFHVTPGLHALKIKIRRDYFYPDIAKSLEFTTPVNPIFVNGDYRVVRYELHAKINRSGMLRYELKNVEYDDLVSFVRDYYRPGEWNEIISEDLFTKKLHNRAQILQEELYGHPMTEEERRHEEAETFGQETVTMGDVAKQLEGTQHDARLPKNQPFEIIATLKRENN